MAWPLFKTILVVNFGRHCIKPIRSAILRLAAAAVVSAAAGFYVSRIILKIGLPPDLPTIWLSSLVGLVSFILTGGIALIIAPSAGGKYNLINLAGAWPLNPLDSWLIRTLPMLLVWVIVMIGGSWTALSLAQTEMHSPIVFVGSLLIASLAALCLSLTDASVFWRSCQFLAASLAGVYALELAVRHQRAMLAALGSVIYCLFVIRYIYQLRFPPQLRKSRHSLKVKTPPAWSSQVWYLQKIIRHPQTLASLMFSLFITWASALLVQWRQPLATDRSFWLVFGAMVSLALASEVRGLSRRYRALDIGGLKSVGYFQKRQIWATATVAVFINLPLLIYVLNAPDAEILPVLRSWAGLQALALSSGLLGGALIIPSSGEAGAQFMSAGTASIVYIGLAKLIAITGAGDSQWSAYIACSTVVLLVCHGIELRRRFNYGHARALT